jgi:hypothetical protein
MSKTSIGTNIYCGMRIGISSHLYGNIANDVPSYVIYGQGIGSENAQMDGSSAIKFQKRMMSRRNISMSTHYENMMKTIFDMTIKERKDYGMTTKKVYYKIVTDSLLSAFLSKDRFFGEARDRNLRRHSQILF